eukprot:2617415-Rhodomonas_salina.2
MASTVASFDLQQSGRLLKRSKGTLSPEARVGPPRSRPLPWHAPMLLPVLFSPRVCDALPFSPSALALETCDAGSSRVAHSGFVSGAASRRSWQLRVPRRLETVVISAS